MVVQGQSNLLPELLPAMGGAELAPRRSFRSGCWLFEAVITSSPAAHVHSTSVNAGIEAY